MDHDGVEWDSDPKSKAEYRAAVATLQSALALAEEWRRVWKDDVKSLEASLALMRQALKTAIGYLRLAGWVGRPDELQEVLDGKGSGKALPDGSAVLVPRKSDTAPLVKYEIDPVTHRFTPTPNADKGDLT